MLVETQAVAVQSGRVGGRWRQQHHWCCLCISEQGINALVASITTVSRLTFLLRASRARKALRGTTAAAAAWKGAPLRRATWVTVGAVKCAACVMWAAIAAALLLHNPRLAAGASLRPFTHC